MLSFGRDFGSARGCLARPPRSRRVPPTPGVGPASFVHPPLRCTAHTRRRVRLPLTEHGKAAERLSRMRVAGAPKRLLSSSSDTQPHAWRCLGAAFPSLRGRRGVGHGSRWTRTSLGPPFTGDGLAMAKPLCSKRARYAPRRGSFVYWRVTANFKRCDMGWAGINRQNGQAILNTGAHSSSTSTGRWCRVASTGKRMFGGSAGIGGCRSADLRSIFRRIWPAP